VTSPRPLRILIVTAYALPHIGGVEVVASQQARSLAALGHQVTVLTSRCGAGAAAREQDGGVTVIRVPAWNGLERRLGLPVPLWSPRAAVWLAWLTRRADIVHVHDAYHPASMLAAALARWRGRPCFLTQHVGMVPHDRQRMRLAQQAVYATAGRVLWRWAETVTVYNPIVADFLAARGVPAAKVRLAGNGIDTSYFRPGQPGVAAATRQRYQLAPELPVVLFAGRLVPKKGLSVLLAAHDPGYQLVIAGPGPRPSPVPPGARFLGPVSRAELRDLYQASDIVACPAVGEMLTLAMQEAMACGVPVVATAHPGYARCGVDPDGVALVAPAAAALQAEFRAILASPERAARMRQYSRRLAQERFSWDANAAQLTAGYATALQRRGVPPRRPGPRPRRAAVAAAMLVAGSSLLVPSLRHQWALTLGREPAPYTALFFDRPGALPGRVPAGRPVGLTFTIANHEGRPEKYTYLLTAHSRQGARPLGRSTRAVPPGGSWTVSARVLPGCAGPPCRVQVSLPGHPETIDILLTPTGPGEPRGATPGHRHH
jgi:D-inositol-3-phosphate glycosyltransferase